MLFLVTAALWMVLAQGGAAQGGAAQGSPPLQPLLQSGASVEDLSATGRLIAQWHPQQPVLYRRQELAIRLVLGIEESLLNEQCLPLFQTRLDWPVQLRGALALEQAGEAQGELDGLQVRRIEPQGTAGTSLALAETRVLAESLGTLELDGRRYAALALEWKLRAELAGEYRLPAPSVRLAYATRFRDDLLQGRVPLDRRDARWVGGECTLIVKDWPVQGQPPSFRGALGNTLRIEVQTEPASVSAGEPFKVRLRVPEAAGLDPECLPLIAPRKGLDVLSRRVQSSEGALVGEYELIARDPRVLELPLAEWSHLDLGVEPPRYRTEAIRASIVVEVPQPAVEPATDERSVWQWVFFLGSLGLIGLGWVLFLRRKQPLDAQLQRSRVAVATLREQLSRPDARGRAAFELFLALRLGVALHALPRETLAERLSAAGVSGDLAKRLESALHGLEAADFGSDPRSAAPQDASRHALALAEELLREDEERQAARR